MHGIRLGRILGFEVRIDLSWFIIFFLILWSFSYGVFPATVPGQSPRTYLIMGVAGALLFFSSLLAHELSHSVVARAKGIPVDGITLFIFGGIAHTRMEAEEPGDEFVIAGVGPLSSLVIAGVLYLIALLAVRLGWPEPVSVVLEYIAVLNVILAVFNLLPGFPLDGGRLFRSAVWKFTGDLDKATRYASLGGRALGYALVGLGILQAFAGGLFGGLWLVFIGWFLRNAAISSYTQHVLRDILSGVRARDLMTPNPEAVPADLTLRALLEEHFMRRRYVSFPVVDGIGNTLGLITLARIKEVPRDEWEVRTAREAMIPADAKTVVAPEDRMLGVMEKLRASPARRVLVMRNGELLGIITANDVAGWVQKVQELRR